MILLIDNYDSFTFNLHHSLSLFASNVTIARNDSISLQEIEGKVANKTLRGIVLSPGPGRPENAGKLLPILEQCLGKIPILGVCLGHQAIGMVFGASVIKAPQIFHGKASKILHNGKGLYQGLTKPFFAARYHSLCLDPETITKSLLLDAWTENGTVMGVSSVDLHCYGVQFHPESILTERGNELVKNFIKISYLDDKKDMV